jgi:hypothetical protein
MTRPLFGGKQTLPPTRSTLRNAEKTSTTAP